MTSMNETVSGENDSGSTYATDEETPFNVMNNLVWYSYCPNDHVNDISHHIADGRDDLSIISSTSSCAGSIHRKMLSKQSNKKSALDQREVPVLWFPGIYFPSHMCEFKFMNQMKDCKNENTKYTYCNSSKNAEDPDLITITDHQINMMSEVIDSVEIPVLLSLHHVILDPCNNECSSIVTKDSYAFLEYVQQRVHVPTQNSTATVADTKKRQVIYGNYNFLEKLDLITKLQTSHVMGSALYDIFQASLKWIRTFMLYSCNSNPGQPGRGIPITQQQQYVTKDATNNKKNEKTCVTNNRDTSTTINNSKTNRVSIESSVCDTMSRTRATNFTSPSPKERQERRLIFDDETTTVATHDDESTLAASYPSPNQRMNTTIDGIEKSTGKSSVRQTISCMKNNASQHQPSEPVPAPNTVTDRNSPVALLNEKRAMDDKLLSRKVDSNKMEDSDDESLVDNVADTLTADCTSNSTSTDCCDIAINTAQVDVEEKVTLPPIEALDSWSVVWTKLQFSGWYERGVDKGNIVYVRNHSGANAVKNSDYFDSISAVQDFIRFHCKHWVWTKEVKDKEKKEKPVYKNKKGTKKNKRLLSTSATTITSRNKQKKPELKNMSKLEGTGPNANEDLSNRENHGTGAVNSRKEKKKKTHLSGNRIRNEESFVDNAKTTPPKDDLSFSSGVSNSKSSSSLSSTDSLTSEQYNCFSTLWKKLKNEGWTHVNATNKLYNWYYKPPNSKGVKDGEIGIDYFQTEECVLEYYKKEVEKKRCDNATNGTKKRSTSSTSITEPSSKRLKNEDEKLIDLNVAVSSMKKSIVDSRPNKTKRNHKSSTDCWWKCDNIPSNEAIWPLLERIGYQVTDGWYLLPTSLNQNRATYIPRFKALSGLRKFLCWKGIANYAESLAEFNDYEHQQMQRWVRFANVPVTHATSVNKLKDVTNPKNSDSIMRLLYKVNFTSVDKKIYIPNADNLPGGRNNRSLNVNYFDSTDSTDLRTYVRGAWMLGLEASFQPDPITGEEHKGVVVRYEKPSENTRSPSSDVILQLSLWGATSSGALPKYKIPEAICQWEVKYLEELEDETHSSEYSCDDRQLAGDLKDYSCKVVVNNGSESSIDTDSDHCEHQAIESNWYQTESLPPFLDVVFPILKKLGFVYSATKGYHHPHLPDLHSAKDIELRQKLCKTGIPYSGTSVPVLNIEEEENLRRWTAFANVPVNSSNSCTMLNKIQLPNEKKVIALLTSKIGFIKQGNVFYPPGVDCTVIQNMYEAGVHYFNDLAEVRDFIRASPDYQVDVNISVSRRPGRRSKASLTASEELQIRLWAALSPTPIPTQGLQETNTAPQLEIIQSTPKLTVDKQADTAATIAWIPFSLSGETSQETNEVNKPPINVSEKVSPVDAVMVLDSSTEPVHDTTNCTLHNVEQRLLSSVVANNCDHVEHHFLRENERTVEDTTVSFVTQSCPYTVVVPGNNENHPIPHLGQALVDDKDVNIVCQQDRKEMDLDTSINNIKDVTSSVRECTVSDPVFPNIETSFCSCETNASILDTAENPGDNMEIDDGSRLKIVEEKCLLLSHGIDTDSNSTSNGGLLLYQATDNCNELNVELASVSEANKERSIQFCSETSADGDILLTQVENITAGDSCIEVETDVLVQNKPSNDEGNYQSPFVDNEASSCAEILLTQAENTFTSHSFMETENDVHPTAASDENNDQSAYFCIDTKTHLNKDVNSLISPSDDFATDISKHCSRDEVLNERKIIEACPRRPEATQYNCSGVSDLGNSVAGSPSATTEDRVALGWDVHSSPQSYVPFLTQPSDPCTQTENDSFVDDHDIGF